MPNKATAPAPPDQATRLMQDQKAQKFLMELMALNEQERHEMRRAVGQQNNYLRVTGQLI